MNVTDTIPTSGHHRGVPLHALQSTARIEETVKPEIDAVYLLPDVVSLARYILDRTKPPEARLFAEARAKAAWSLAAENREVRPSVDLAKLAAAVAGLNSLKWLDPDRIGTLLEPSEGRPLRQVDLPDELARLVK